MLTRKVLPLKSTVCLAHSWALYMHYLTMSSQNLGERRRPRIRDGCPLTLCHTEYSRQKTPFKQGPRSQPGQSPGHTATSATLRGIFTRQQIHAPSWVCPSSLLGAANTPITRNWHSISFESLQS